ncbi:MAG: FG-GAP-like repeat-containing protein, partial [Anaerolineales bacterium]
ETSSRIAQSPNSDPWIINLLLLDLNGDGDLDIAAQTMGGDPDTLPVYVNDGWGTFSAPQFELSILHTWLYTFVDLDGDGGLDILTSYPAGESSPEMHFIARDLGCR